MKRNLMTYYINPILTEREKDLIKGTVLGGSTIIKPKGGKNCYLSMRSKFGAWLDYKANELRGLSSQEPMTIEKTNRWHSLCYPIFNDLHKMFWQDKERKINQKIFDELSFYTLMIWFGDTGTYKGGIIQFNTHIWGEEGTNQIVDYFNKVNYKSKVFLERKKFRIKFDFDSSENFMKSISPHMPYFLAEQFSKNIL